MNDHLVCTVETAKKLQKLGAPQNTSFYWTEPNPGHPELHFKYDTPDGFKTYAAYTASEASESFPEEIWVVNDKSLKKREAMLYFARHKNIYKVSLMIKDANGKDFFELHRVEDTNEAEARSVMYAYLLANHMLQATA
jgi:hypothetical protein